MYAHASFLHALFCLTCPIHQISDRDERAEKHGVKFVLAGDSCVPGINCDDLETVFEEHAVVKKFDAMGSNDRTYSLDQRTFSFGAVFVNEQAEAKLRITNPFKIPCNVEFVVAKRANSKDEGEFPFDVQVNVRTTMLCNAYSYVMITNVL